MTSPVGSSVPGDTTPISDEAVGEFCGVLYQDRCGERWFRCTVHRSKAGHIHHGVFLSRAQPVTRRTG